MSNPTSAQAAILVDQAYRLARAYVVDTLRTEGVQTIIGGWTFYDVRHLLDHREHSSETIDQIKLMLDHGLAAQILMQHPTQPHLFHVVNRGGI